MGKNQKKKQGVKSSLSESVKRGKKVNKRKTGKRRKEDKKKSPGKMGKGEVNIRRIEGKKGKHEKRRKVLEKTGEKISIHF